MGEKMRDEDFYEEYNSQDRINWEVEDKVDKFANGLTASIGALVGFFGLVVLVAAVIL